MRKFAIATRNMALKTIWLFCGFQPEVFFVTANQRDVKTAAENHVCHYSQAIAMKTMREKVKAVRTIEGIQ